MVSAYLKSIDEASNLDEVSRCIYDAINSDDLYTFGELLNNAKVISLKNSPKHAKFYTLLQLFAYGVYSDVPALKNEIPELNDVMVQKLRQLTLISLCNQHKRCISIKDAMQSLYLNNVSDLHLLFINAIYKGIIQGRVNSEEGVLEVNNWVSRDVRDEEINEMINKLKRWIEDCEDVGNNLKNIASSAESAICEAIGNENKIEEEVRRIRKSMQDNDDEQRIGVKDYRRQKSQRGRKHL